MDYYSSINQLYSLAPQKANTSEKDLVTVNNNLFIEQKGKLVYNTVVICFLRCEIMDENKNLIIRNSTAEFLTFELQTKEDSIEVRYEDENLWLTQKMMGMLFDVSVPTVNEHLKNIYNSGELDQESTIRKFRIVQTEGNRQVERNIDHYNIDAVISVGYRVNSIRATQFRRWATQVLKQFAITGYVLDRKRMENGAFLGEDYFERLLEEIREIRLSERRFYQKITDIYATSIDYDKDSPITKKFFATVQNKMHYAVTGLTAAELIKDRVSAEKPNMGLTTWESSPDGKILKSDVSVAKNVLTKEEISSLGRIVSAFLDIAEDFANRKIPLTMEDWSNRVDQYLQLTGREVLQNAGSISAKDAKIFAESEFEKYRITQDRLYKSDFDKLLNETKQK